MYSLYYNEYCKKPVVSVDGCVDTMLTVDTVGVVNWVVVTVLSVVTGAVVAVVVNGTVCVVADSVVTVVGAVVDSHPQSFMEDMKYYIEKTAYSLSNVVWADAQKQQKLNVINYKLEYMR